VHNRMRPGAVEQEPVPNRMQPDAAERDAVAPAP
jgi:hypothetical protein